MAAAATRCGEEGGAAAMSGALARAFDDAHADSCAARVQQLACRVRPLLPLPAIENVLGEQAATQEKMAAPTDEASPTTNGIALEDWLPSPTSPRQEPQPPARPWPCAAPCTASHHDGAVASSRALQLEFLSQPCS